MPEDSEQSLLNKIKGIKTNIHLIFCCWGERSDGKALRIDKSWIYRNGSNESIMHTRQKRINEVGTNIKIILVP